MAVITRDENLQSGLAGYAAFFQRNRKEVQSLVTNPELQKKFNDSERLSSEYNNINPDDIRYS